MRFLIGLAAALIAFAPVSAQTPAISPDIARTSLYVPVRDGTKLAVNIYRPAKDGRAVEGRLPVIFSFTPYRSRYRDKDGILVDAAFGRPDRPSRFQVGELVRHGYVVVFADIRGKGASFGRRRGFQDRTEAQDGHDLVEWLARQSFSTGKVGMYGCSYWGGTAYQTTSTVPPSLKAAFIGATDLDKYGFVRRGGITAQFNTRPDEPLTEDLASIPVDADRDGKMRDSAVAEHAANTPMGPLWYGMPYRDSVSSFTGNAFWDEVAVWKHLPAIRKSGIATYFWGNWKDEPTAQSILSAANLPGSKFLAGPGDHCVPPPAFDFAGEVRRFFDHHLKGVDNGIDKEPRATYLVEGQGYVRSALLPGQNAKRVSWALHGGKSGTARSVNDGVLGPMRAASGRDSFTVDYNLPPVDYFSFWIGAMDDHGLSYTSAPLDKPMTLVGFPVVRLAVQADKPNANVFAYLDQVSAAGEAEVVSFGRIALEHRKLSKAPFETLGLPWSSGRKADAAPLKAGETANLAFDLTPISRVIPAGARLRLTITGADPRQRNLADIKQTPPPVLTIIRGTSRIELPVQK